MVDIAYITVLGMTKLRFTEKEVRRMTLLKFFVLFDAYIKIYAVKKAEEDDDDIGDVLNF